MLLTFYTLYVLLLAVDFGEAVSDFTLGAISVSGGTATFLTVLSASSYKATIAVTSTSTLHDIIVNHVQSAKYVSTGLFTPLPNDMVVVYGMYVHSCLYRIVL